MLSMMIRFYARLLGLYPRRFRQDFAAEMVEVFALAVAETLASADTKQQGWRALLALWQRELSTLPVAIVLEHVREQRRRYMNWWSYDEAQGITWARGIARIMGAIIACIVVLSLGTASRTDSLGLLIGLMVTHSIVIAWFREKLGGQLLIGTGAAWAVLYFLQALPAASSVWTGLLFAGMGLLMALPVINLGVLFLLIGRREQSQQPNRVLEAA